MANIALVLSDWGPSQLSYHFISKGNKLVQDGHNVIGFYQNIARPLTKMNFASMNFSEIYDFHGLVVTTNADLLSKCSNLPTRYKLYHFMDFPEWTYNRNAFEPFCSLFRNRRATLLTRCQDYTNLLANNYGVIAINCGYDIEKYMELT